MGVVFSDGVMKSVLSRIIGQPRIGAVLDQEGDDRGVAILGGDHEGCWIWPLVGTAVRVGPLFEKGLDGADIAVFAGFEKIAVRGLHRG